MLLIEVAALVENYLLVSQKQDQHRSLLTRFGEPKFYFLDIWSEGIGVINCREETLI